MKMKIAVLLVMALVMGTGIAFAEQAIVPDHTVIFTFYKTDDTGVATFSPIPPEGKAELKGRMMVQYTGPHMAGFEVPPRSLIAHASRLGANYIYIQEWSR
jgi:hypothetical protein